MPAHGTRKYGEYCGIQDGRVYIVIHEVSSVDGKWSQTAWWIPLQELNADALGKLDSLELKDCRQAS